MCSETKNALRRVADRYVVLCHQELGSLPRLEHDPAWESPCQVGDPDARGLIYWRPVARGNEADFSGLERALETAIDPQIKAYYGSLWCNALDAQAEEGGLTLIQVWNADDFDRLCENILGHALAKRRVKAPLTVFFACTDESELMLSIDNATGRVVLEQPGCEPMREVAASLAEFLDRVEPIVKHDL